LSDQPKFQSGEADADTEGDNGEGEELLEEEKTKKKKGRVLSKLLGRKGLNCLCERRDCRWARRGETVIASRAS
jgi:hypothetical protein